ncbi:c-type cytochrome [Elioraea sp.]|uniref:c-type cytochrome n=1 Tax=Elioraea sp. TaxID=2185103 RepID=UPI003F6F4B82
MNKLRSFILASTILAVPALADTPQVARGQYLVDVVMQCGTCHDTPDARGRADPAMRQAGGRVFANVGLRAVTPNITPDPDTGIGAWTAAQFADAMRNGRRPDGSLIGPPMPVEAYRGISDGDLAAVWAYLRTIPPVRNPVTERSSFPRSPTRFEPVATVPAPPGDDPVRRGEYLAVTLLHCMDCHSPRVALDRADPARIGAGGRVFQTPSGPLPARNITPHPDAGIGAWTEAEVWRVVAEGIGRDGRRLYLTMGSRAAGWARMTEGDRADLLAYLRALPPLE